MGSRGGSGLQKTLVDFESFVLGGRSEAVLQGDQNGLPVLPLEPLVGLHRRLWSDGVRVQILLEEIRLHSETIQVSCG